MTELIRLEHISKRFGGTIALDDVSFSIAEGEIHAVMGENGAGKSTLMKILSGVLEKDSGRIIFGGVERTFLTPIEAQRAGITTVYQEPQLAPHLTVAENIFLGREPTRGFGIVDYEAMNARTGEILGRLELSLSPKSRLADLSPADVQLVQIARAIAFSTKLLILDEPTASITEHETEILFGVLKKLNAAGLTILYISHRIAEIFQLCKRATVLRDGKYCDTVDVEGISERAIITLMVGRELQEEGLRETTAAGAPGLDVRNVTVSNAPVHVRNVSFTVRKGEIVALAGLVGSGRSEVARAVFGLNEIDSGEVFLHGKRVEIRNPDDAIAHGISFVPEDRKAEGLIVQQSVKQNISLTGLRRLTKLGFIRGKAETTLARASSEQLAVKAASEEIEVSTLSGGNQQKVVLAKWLWLKPSILMLDEPTRGIDVGAKSEIHKLILELAHGGVAVLLISSELPEVLALADRIYVMRDGAIAGELRRAGATQEAIMHLAAIGSQRQYA